MAAADYTIRGAGPITFRARLADEVEPQDVIFPLTDIMRQLIKPLPGMGVMIEDEICRVVSSTFDAVTLARGCADTIPQQHGADALLWFFEDAVGSDNIEYAVGETIGVKVLMHTETREMGIDDAPPNELSFVGRFIRPYPPGRMRVAGTAWHSANTDLGGGLTTLALSWAHRNRVTQSDQLVDHEMTDVTPEVGTTYSITVHKADNSVVRTVTGITGTSYTYTFTDAVADLGPMVTPGVEIPGYLMLRSVRDGFSSYQAYRIDFTVTLFGWGSSWGSSWGG